MTRAIRAPRERTAGDTKQRILDAAAAEFGAKGFDGARLGAIARAARVQQPLIYHYFGDKQSLHAEVLRSGVAAMVEDAWRIVSRMEVDSGERGESELRAVDELRALADAYVELLLAFLSTNGALLAMLRHEAREGSRGRAATKAIAEHVAPLFEATATRIDEMQQRGEVRAGVDSRELIISIVSMVAFPFEEEAFVSLLWPSAVTHRERIARRKQHVVEMILAHVVP